MKLTQESATTRMVVDRLRNLADCIETGVLTFIELEQVRGYTERSNGMRMFCTLTGEVTYILRVSENKP